MKLVAKLDNAMTQRLFRALLVAPSRNRLAPIRGVGIALFLCVEEAL